MTDTTGAQQLWATHRSRAAFPVCTPLHRALGAALTLLLVLTFEKDMFAATPDTEARNKQAVTAAFERWRRGTGGVFELLAPNAHWTIVGNSPVSRTYKSRQEFLDAVIQPFNARLSKRLVPTVRSVHADGDTVIALWDGEGLAKDGKAYRNTYAWFMEMRGDKIVNVVAFFDTIAFTELWTRVKPEEPPVPGAK